MFCSGTDEKVLTLQVKDHENGTHPHAERCQITVQRLQHKI